MKLTVLGTGSPLPIPNRVQTGYLLEKDDQLLLLDCGAGVYDQLQRLKVDWSRLDTVLISHHHLDHMNDLLTIFTSRWLLGYPQSTVYGPPGTEKLVKDWMALFPYVNDFVDASIHDIDPAQSHHLKGFDIDVMEMSHYIQSLSYKFDQTLAICGDSDPLPGLKDFSQNCKLMFHECSYTDEQADNGHANPTDLGRVLEGSNLEELRLTHFYPTAAERSDEMVQAVKKHFNGKVGMAEDFQQIEF
jgi:ribonuclease BN (tRNA processing enzyme)